METVSEINRLLKEAQTRWLKPAELVFILENCDHNLITPEPLNKPPSGSLFLFNRRTTKFFRNDGHAWRRKKDGRTVGEAHEKLKVGNIDRLNCYYAHGENNPTFQRRCYWILDPALEHIVLVHYRDVSEGKYFMSGIKSEWLTTSPVSVDSVGDNNIDESPNIACSPLTWNLMSRESFVETAICDVDGYDHISEGSSTSLTPPFILALKKLELQLSLEEADYNHVQESKPTLLRKDCFQPQRHINESEGFGCAAQADDCNGMMINNYGSDQNSAFQPDGSTWLNENQSSIFWEDMLELTASRKPQLFSQEKYSEEPPSRSTESKNQNFFLRDMKENDGGFCPELSTTLSELEDLMSPSRDCEANNSGQTGLDHEKNSEWHLSEARRILLGPESPINTETSVQKTPGFEERCISSEGSTVEWMSNNFGYCSSLELPKEQVTSFDQRQSLPSVESSSCLTLSEKHRFFNIREISPDWSYSDESTKVIIVGDFLHNHLQYELKVMFGDTEVPSEMIQKGVILCHAPQLPPGKVGLWLSSVNKKICSEVRDFKYRAKPDQLDPTMHQRKNVQEQDLLIKFGQILLGGCDSYPDPTAENTRVDVADWLLQELLKDKLKQWIDSKACNWAREDQSIIHLVSGLGLEWALGPLLAAGVGVNFRDSNGWTALHWAARFGRETMVAALLAAGASAGAVTDPTGQNPSGKTPASIASENNHRGLAGYLSEVALTTHLSSLTVAESDVASRVSSYVAADVAVESINQKSVEVHPGATEDQLCLKDSLAAVRNAAQAAARIQSAFRAHSFRKKQMKAQIGGDEQEIRQLSAASKALRPPRDSKLQSAALYIQRKYRGWVGRRSFLNLRRNVVKIQAHVRGHLLRKKYKEFIWTVGVLEKVILRWRRRGSGLRGFKAESDAIVEEIKGADDDDDILKVFRKQKVDAALDEALKRVLSMADSAEARQQYRRMLESYRLAKADTEGIDPAEVAMVFDSRDDDLWPGFESTDPRSKRDDGLG